VVVHPGNLNRKILTRGLRGPDLSRGHRHDSQEAAV
jgi:hypothetical protein